MLARPATAHITRYYVGVAFRVPDRLALIENTGSDKLEANECVTKIDAAVPDGASKGDPLSRSWL